MKQFLRYVVIGIPMGAVIGGPLLWFRVARLKTLLWIVAIFEIGALVGSAWMYVKLLRRRP